MNPYIVTLAPAPGVVALATATSFERPDVHIQQVACQLREHHVQGTVVVDLLAANGSLKHRFFSVPFDGEHLLIRDLAQVHEPSEELVAAAAQAIRVNLAEIDLSLVCVHRREELLVGASPATLRTLVRPGEQSCCMVEAGCPH